MTTFDEVTQVDFEAAAAAKGVDFKRIALEDIIEDTVNLRGSLEESKKQIGEEWNRGLRSVQKNGILQPLLVRPFIKDDGTVHKTRVILVDGMQRKAWATKAGFTHVPCYVNPNIQTPADVLIAQTQCNLQRIKTSVAALEKHCLQLDEVCGGEMSVDQLADLLNMSPQWVRATLKMKNLSPQVEAAMNDGQIPVTHAKVLSKLPTEHQDDFLNKLLSQDIESRNFISVVHDFAGKLKKAKKGIKVDEGPIPQPRTKTEDLEMLEQCRQNDPHGRLAGLLWHFQLDEESLKERNENAEIRKLKQEQKKLQKQREDAAKRQREIEERLAQAESEIEGID